MRTEQKVDRMNAEISNPQDDVRLNFGNVITLIATIGVYASTLMITYFTFNILGK